MAAVDHRAFRDLPSVPRADRLAFEFQIHLPSDGAATLLRSVDPDEGVKGAILHGNRFPGMGIRCALTHISGTFTAGSGTRFPEPHEARVAVFSGITAPERVDAPRERGGSSTPEPGFPI